MILVIFVLMVTGGFYFLHGKLSHLPDWYKANKAEPQIILRDIEQSKKELNTDPVSKEKIKRKQSERINSHSPKQHIKDDNQEILLGEDRFVPFFIEQFYKINDFNGTSFIKANKTTYEYPFLKIELIVDAKKIPAENLSTKAQVALSYFFRLTEKQGIDKVYIHMKLLPFVEKDYIYFKHPSTLSIGKINLAVRDIEKKFGVNSRVALKSFDLSEFRWKKDKIFVKIQPDTKTIHKETQFTQFE
jgi:hypothetical protein